MTVSAPDRLCDETTTDVAEILVDIGAIRIGTDEQFKFASGLPSPVYCDNRLLLSRPCEREAIVRQLVRLITQVAGVYETDWDAVAGVASAGIPFAAWVAHEFRAPMVYIRPEAKDHGTKRRIEGGLAVGNRVVLVEDLVTTGGSALSAVSALRAADLKCSHCFSIVDYGFDFAARRFEADGIRLSTLTDTTGLLGALRTSVNADDLARVRAWHSHVNATGGSVPT